MDSVNTISAAAEDNSTVEATLPREGLLTFLFSVAVVLVIMNTAMFNLALPDVTETFGISASAASWIVTGYSIMFSIASITYSRLSDFLPIRRLLSIGLLTLGLAAVAGFFSTNFIVLLIVRIVQASGAGAVMSLSLVLFTRYVPLGRRGKAMATIMSSVSLGLGLGPVAGGAITQYFGWNWLFAVTAIILLLVPLFLVLLPKELPSRGSFDALGGVFLGIGTTGLLLFLTSGLWIALIAGIAAIFLFVSRIRTISDPFVMPALFKNRPYLVLSLVGIASYLCSFATLFLLPQILVHRFGFTASHAGFVIFPGSLLAIFVSRSVGRIIDRFGNGGILRFVPLLVLTATVLFALFAGHSWIAVMFVYMIMSLAFTTLSSSVSNEISRVLPSSQIGSGMGLFQLLQFFSGAFGVAMAASALEWQHGLSLSAAYSNIYWGLSIAAIIAIVSAFAYRRSSGSRIEEMVEA
ncbi:MFS transporter [Paenibacillus jilunlii]|uniref:MFS transporter, DHA2 family, metal-tetracycline-proton antiporter n=1 Tax=Paenibacillus jilunlii TaxID=682956 RepID=A0A1G9TJ52_9BACL|nr:MFS transporter [Paenibacillus jilunlii]KWX71980.1 tetracycline resistance protein TetA [Paenibacillus jilunlii]SDM47494.1 MFS transporter, DHA2 family, metal-tetracycline-proton antiporter [Paenibacillus jilunlii]